MTVCDWDIEVEMFDWRRLGGRIVARLVVQGTVDVMLASPNELPPSQAPQKRVGKARLLIEA